MNPCRPATIKLSREAPLFPGEEGLAPLRLGHLTQGVKLPFHLFTSAGGGRGEFVLSCPRGRAYGGETAETAWGYFALAEAPEVLAFLLARLDLGPTGDESLVLAVDTLLVWVQHFFAHSEARTPAQVDTARRLLHSCRQFPVPGGLSFQTLLRWRRHDSGLFSHSLNVCLLSLVFGPCLEETREDLEVFALGALLHDLGMMTLPLDPFQHCEPLEDDLWEAIKEHPSRGVDLLRPLQILSDDALLMIGQHHETHDGSGYPGGLTGEDIHPWARVLRLLDSYEAMTSLRAWRPPLGKGEVCRIMATAWKAQGACHPELLERFLSLCRQD